MKGLLIGMHLEALTLFAGASIINRNGTVIYTHCTQEVHNPCTGEQNQLLVLSGINKH